MAADSSKRLSGSRDHFQPAAVAQSPGEHHASQKQGGSSHKRHVAGSSRLGARNPSIGRNLSKLTITAAKDDDGASKGTNGPPVSPRLRPGSKRSQTQSSLMPRNASGTVLRKNHSSGHLARNSSGKHLSKSHRPDYHRTRSHDDRKSKQRPKSPSPPPKERHASVRFDIGDNDDEAEEMEGVDDVWTEESASQSPQTTRDNTRSNTRNNSIVLDPADNPNKVDADKPPDKQDSSGETSSQEIEGAFEQLKETPSIGSERKSSYHEELHQPKPPDAEAIAKRLLQRNESRLSQPQVTDVSVTTSSNSPHDPSQGSLPRLQARTSPSHASPASASTTMVSRFIEPSDSAPGSKDGTPRSPAALSPRPQREPSGKTAANQPQQTKQRSALRSDRTRDRDRNSQVRRNQSTPSFILPPTSPPLGTDGQGGGSGTASGASTPGGPLRQSRTQQKLWLQRGLSNIEANSQSNLQGMLIGGAAPGNGLLMRRGVNGIGGGDGRGGGGGALSGGGAGSIVGAGERIERELVAVRRYRHPIEESIKRLRKVKGGPLQQQQQQHQHQQNGTGKSISSRATSPRKPGVRAGGGAKTPASARSRANSPGGMARSSFNSVREGEEEGGRDGGVARKPERDWLGLGLEELEEATLEVRRQMWELQSGADADD